MRESPESRDVLVLPSDLPLLRASDIRKILTLKSKGLDVVLSPSQAFDGTNALLFPRGSPVRLSYDDNSFWAHLASAASHGLSVGVYAGTGVMFDVDSPEDLDALARTDINSKAAAFARRVDR
jgi:2-phospho-L-lactate guanylyltransferase